MIDGGEDFMRAVPQKKFEVQRKGATVPVAPKFETEKRLDKRKASTFLQKFSSIATLRSSAQSIAEETKE